MIKLYDGGVYWRHGAPEKASAPDKAAREKTMAYSILREHDGSGGASHLRIRFDSLISHDITYVGIIQTAKASGLTKFPLPYALTNCHNSLCAVGGTINEDDHVFGLSAARRYGGIYVPANLAVIHQYAREALAGCGRMILGSDSHTRYGPLGTLGVGEGGPELVKQLLEDTYDISAPEVVLVYLSGTPARGVGPQDVAIALCGAVYKNSFVKNRILEFAGPGVANLPMDFRFGIDVMTTETACLSSIWSTDGRVEEYLAVHGRPEAYRSLEPTEGCYYDRLVEIDLSTIEPMAAMPFHPSEAITLRELIANPGDILREAELRAEAQFGDKVSLHLTDKVIDGKLHIDQGSIAGCSGGMYDNIAEAAAILDGHGIGDGYFSLSIYPPSIPVQLELARRGVEATLLQNGALFKPCFCGPCFGAGDVPNNNGLSIRHTTRNFPNREGSKPGEGQLAAVMLMDARSIAATARNHGVLTAATDIDYTAPVSPPPAFDKKVYERRVYNGWENPMPEEELRFGPNIAPWPDIPQLADDLLLELTAVIHDEVTTTDELIPSGETSSFRSNPIRLAEFALSRREPEYVGRCKAVQALEADRAAGKSVPALEELLRRAGVDPARLANTSFNSTIFARKPGDGSAREQAASCQRVLGGGANLCYDFATKRYRSNCINWGMMPFTIDPDISFDYAPGDYIYVPDVRRLVQEGAEDFPAVVLAADGSVTPLTLHTGLLTDEDRQILLEGCLMNLYAARRK
ncbi:MAG: hydratase [Eubacteriales bacterium]|nr:hydratase [Eubacteriales bacterium]